MTSDEKLEKFKLDLKTDIEVLNREGIWLFLATLGCWSVGEEKLRFAALIITCFLFVRNIVENSPIKKTYKKTYQDIEQTIRDEFEDEKTMKAYLFDLENIKKSTSIFNFAKKLPIFILCYAFLIATIFNFAEPYLPF
jgi:hypothetical protein